MTKAIKRNRKEEYYRNLSEDAKIQKRSYANLESKVCQTHIEKEKKRTNKRLLL